MNLPLQPELRPGRTWYGRLVWPLAIVMVVVLLGGTPRARPSAVRVLTNDGPVADRYLATVGRLADNAQERIWVMLYVARLGSDPDRHCAVRWLSDRLIAAHQRGLAVRVVLDRSCPDRPWPGPDNTPTGDYLAAGGVTVVYDEIDRTTHAKMVLADGQGVVGSHNWTNSALGRNREVSLLSAEPAVIEQIEAVFTAVAGWP